MPLLFTCPHCQTSTQVDDCYSGHEGACVTCGKAIQIPDFDTATGQAPETGQRYSFPKVLSIGLALVILLCLGFLLVRTGGDTMERIAATRARSESVSNLRQIAAALNAYARDHGTYPPPTLKVGANTHSWRILILPYLNENTLYDQYDFDKSWDSEDNMRIGYNAPAVFRNPTHTRNQGLWAPVGSEAHYFLITGPGTLFPKTGPLSPEQISDDAGQTLLLAEARLSGQRVTFWIEPEDFDISKLQANTYAELGGILEEEFAFATVDEQVRFLPEATDPLVIRAAVTANGGERLSSDVFD